MDNRSDDRIYIVKMKNQASVLNAFRTHLNESIRTEKPPAYYNLTGSTSPYDIDMVNSMDEGIEYKLAFLDYQESDIFCIYWCLCKKYEADEKSLYTVD